MNDLFSWGLINTLQLHNQWSHQGCFQFIKRLSPFLFYVYPIDDKMTIFKWEIYNYLFKRLVASGASKNHRIASIKANEAYEEIIRSEKGGYKIG